MGKSGRILRGRLWLKKGCFADHDDDDDDVESLSMMLFMLLCIS
jgi:hypothetical protein